MSFIHHLDCCGVKEFAQAQTHFQGNRPLKDNALAAIKCLLAEWTHQEETDIDDDRGLYNPELLPLKIAWKMTKYGGAIFAPRAAHVIFSDANLHTFKWGEALRDCILDLRLGTVIQTEDAKNPNTGHTISTFIWTLDRKAIEAFLENNPISKEKWKSPGTIVRSQGGVTKEYCDEWDEYYQYILPEMRKQYSFESDPEYYSQYHAARETRKYMKNTPEERRAILDKIKTRLADEARAAEEAAAKKAAEKAKLEAARLELLKTERRAPGAKPGRITKMINLG